MQCPGCRHENRAHARFCEACGTPLGHAHESGSPGASYTDLERALFEELEARKRELTEALERQTATGDILQVISRSPTEVQPVFDAVVTSAARLCEAHDVAMLLVEGDDVRLVAGVGPLHASFPSDLRIQLTRGSAATRAVVDRTTIHIHDFAAESEEEYPVGRELARRFGHRSMLTVPLLREGVPIGVICAFRLEVRPFPDQQIALLRTFADQAVIAIENVRLFTELQQKNRALSEAHAQVTEALEQQTATSEILRTIAHAQTDAQPVFDTIVRSAARLCRATTAAVFLSDGRTLHHPANYGGSPEVLAAVRARYPRPLDTDTVPGITVLTRAVVHVPDAEDPSVIEEVRQIGRVLGFRSIVAVPMLREGEAFGAILVTRREPGRFSDGEVELLKTFADQAVIAIENAKLFTELQEKNRALTRAHEVVTEALEQQTATSEILGVISASPTDLQPVLDAVVKSAARFCGADDASIFRLDGDELRAAAHHGPGPQPPGLRLPIVKGTVGGRTVLEKRTILVADLQAETEEFPEGSALARQLNQRTTLSTPLLREGTAIGVIMLRRLEVNPFTDKQVGLLQTFADQAVIAIENVRLFTELQEKNRALTAAHRQVTEALEQQIATGEVLRAISSSAMDAQPVFQTIAESAVRLSGALFGSVYRFDGELVHMAAHHNYSRAALEFSDRFFPSRPNRQSFTGRAIVERAVVHVPDVSKDQERLLAREVAEVVGFRSALSVPMLRDGAPIGAITVFRSVVGPFPDQHVALLQTFADQAIIAIQSERLFKELEARTTALARSVDQLTALGEVGRAVSSTLDLATVLTTIVSRAVELSGLDGGVVFEYDEADEEFTQRAAAETGGALAVARRGTRVRKGEGVVGRTAITLEPVQVPDITVPGFYVGPNRQNLIDSGVRAILAVPMLRESRLIGCLGVTRNRPGEFSTETIELLRTFATQSALAIQNARLFHEIEDKSRQLEAASRHKSEFLANMSHELRTPLNAVIGFSEVLLQRMFGALNDKQDEYLKDIYASGQHLLSLINDILDLSKIEAGRMELATAPFHLPTALENAIILVKERASRHGIALEVEFDQRLGEIVGDERKVKQVLLNLLSNAVKFTPEGGSITLKAGRRDGAVEISVTDTGIGIAPEDQMAIFEEFRQVGSDERKREGTGLGLTLAKKFVELHGGRIWVESKPGHGSTFTFTLPVA